MSVNCNKFVGYCIDIMDDWCKLDDDSKELWLEDFSSDNLDKHNSINFRPYYNRAGSLKDKVTVIYDGMSGRYCKLMYVVDYEVNTEEENSDNIVDSINELLKDSATPFSIKKSIKEVYKEIFGVDMNNTSSIKAEYLVHWS